MSASDPLALALRLLARRDHGAAELGAALRRRGLSEESIAATLDRCRELGYVDDRRLAFERARGLVRSGRAIGARVLLDLRRRGIDAHLAKEALRAAEEEHAPREALQALLDQRFPGFALAQAEPRELRRLLSFFQRRGFSAEQIFSVLKNHHERDFDDDR